MKYVFIINPIAGNDNKAKILSRIRSTFRWLNDEMILEETKHQGDATKLAAAYAAQYGADCVIVSCGGDGTVHEIANGLAHTETPLMILPLGTGNDFAKKVYGAKNINVENVIKSFGLYNGKIRYDIQPIDLIDYNGEKCINVMSFGADTMVAMRGKKIEEKAPFLGHLVYDIAIVPVLMKPLHYQISFDITCVNGKTGEEYQMRRVNQDYSLFAICNASYYGGGFCPAPHSRLDDGLLDFALVRGLSLPEAVKLLPYYSKGKASQERFPQQITNGYIKSGSVWTENGSSLLCNCDGEGFNDAELHFYVDEKALKLCVIKE